MKRKNELIYLGVLAGFTAGVFFGAAAERCNLAHNNYYSINARVSNVDYITDVVTVTDISGHVWQFNECEDWLYNDQLILFMDDNGTPLNIKDDVIKHARYIGY